MARVIAAAATSQLGRTVQAREGAAHLSADEADRLVKTMSIPGIFSCKNIGHRRRNACQACHVRTGCAESCCQPTTISTLARGMQ